MRRSIPLHYDQNRLLINSYVISAERILMALGESQLIGLSSSSDLIIQNSRNPSDPPNAPAGVVVGLCSQGGRHWYFDVPVTPLKRACEDIINLQRTANVGKLQSICSRLRRSASFNSDSGCINDAIPRIVPLMPPEEIWLDGNQLPFDVWRLLSFDMDTLSAAIMSDIQLSDLSYGSLNFAALAFTKLVSLVGVRLVEYDLNFVNVDRNVIRSTDQYFQCNLMQLFFEAGSLLTPLSREEDFDRWFLALRYIRWFSEKDSVLKVKKEFKDKKIDSRYRGLFSEEIAIGMMAMVLRERFGVIRINNTVEILPTSSILHKGTIADFVAIGTDNANNQTQIIAECKGSLGQKVSKKRRTHAKEQTSYTGLSLSSRRDSINLVFCGSIYFDDQQKRTECVIEDPPRENNAKFQIDESLGWRVSYAKILRFIGLESAAHEVLNGEPGESLPEEDIEHYEDFIGSQRKDRYRRIMQIRERYHALPLVDVGPASVVMDIYVMRILKRGLSIESQIGLEKYLIKRYFSKFNHDRDQFNFDNHLSTNSHKYNSFINSSGIGLIYYNEL